MTPTNEEHGSNAKYTNAISKLLDSAANDASRQQGNGLKLSIYMYSALKDGELDVTTVREYVSGASAERAKVIVDDLCVLYSARYRQAKEEAELPIDKSKDKTTQQAAKSDAVLRCRAVRKMMTRAMSIGLYLYDAKPVSVVERSGAFKVNMADPNSEDDGTFTFNGMESKAREKFGKSTRAASPPTGTTNTEAPSPVSLKVAAEMLMNNVNGKSISDFTGATRHALEDLLITLAHACAPKGDAVDWSKLAKLDQVRKAG